MINRNRQDGQEGTILIFVLVIMMGLLMLCAFSWRTAYRASLYAQQRALFFERVYATRALLEYGIAYCGEQQEAIKKGILPEKTIDVEQWPPVENAQYDGQLQIVGKKRGVVQLAAQLYASRDRNKTLMSGSCFVQVKNDQASAGQLITQIKDWQILTQ